MAWTPFHLELALDARTRRVGTLLGESRFHAAGVMSFLWVVAYDHVTDVPDTDDARWAYATPEYIDEIVGQPGLADAMRSVELLEFDDDGCTLPRYFAKNGSKANARLAASERKQRERSRKNDVTDMSRLKRDKSVTTEQKRTEPDSGTESGSGSGASGPDLALKGQSGQRRKQRKSLVSDGPAWSPDDVASAVSWYEFQKSKPNRLYPKADIDGDEVDAHGDPAPEVRRRAFERFFTDLATVEISEPDSPKAFFSSLHRRKRYAATADAIALGRKNMTAWLKSKQEVSE